MVYMMVKVGSTMAQPWLSFNDLESTVPTDRSLKRHGVRIDPLAGSHKLVARKRDNTNQFVCWCFVLSILVAGILMTIFLTRDTHKNALAR